MRGVTIVMLAVAIVGMAGCSAMTNRKATVQVDSDRVALINAAARQRGVEVIWVNPPLKKVEAEKSQPANVADR